MNALEIQGLSAWYVPEQPVLRDCSFTLGAHEVVGLIGLNCPVNICTTRKMP